MTRDTLWVVDDSDADFEVFSALLKTAPLPSLPPDAPEELERLTVEVDDPKRVYTIYQASRRHNFQILVERYIIQLRYGCQSACCTTPTCFTCRRRVAGSVPLRRYNATSARTLACHLASQDNPERGLCPNLSGSSQIFGSYNRSRVSTKVKTPPESVGRLQNRNQNKGQRKSDEIVGDRENHSTPYGATVSPARKRSSVSFHRGGQSAINEVDKGQPRATVELGQGPTKKDHKSFVQNLFSTDALKLIEWLTPNNLQVLTAKFAEIHSLFSGVQSASVKPTPPESISAETISTPNEKAVEAIPLDLSVKDDMSSTSRTVLASTSDDQLRELVEGSVAEVISSSPKTNINGSASGNLSVKLPPVPVFKEFPNGHDVKNGCSSEVDSTFIEKEIGPPVDENNVQKCVSGLVQAEPPYLWPHKQKPSELLIPPSPLEHSTTIPLAVENPSPLGFSSSKSASEDPEEVTPHELPTAIGSVPYQEATKSSEVAIDIGVPRVPRAPQSLSALPVEVVDILCRILWEDSKSDLRTELTTLNQADDPIEAKFRNHPRRISFTPLSSSSGQWKSFIEQSIFYVMSDSAALLRSFCDEKGGAFDVQYCMVRLCSFVPSLLFDSLWVAAGDLYTPPMELWDIYDRAKIHRQTFGDGHGAHTTKEAASLMSICLLALIAAVPFLDDEDHFRASRLRSAGLSSLQSGQHVSKWESNISLSYNDVFSNELALRLVRRLFAAIPVRRQYQELSALRELSPSPPLVDILDVILTPLNFVDNDSFQNFDYSPLQRQTLENRIAFLLVDWARTILLQDWNGKAEVRSDGSFGGALATMAAIHGKRKSLFVGDVHFRTQYFADRLDSSEMPVEWLSFAPDKKTSHLLDYPYLFKPSTLVTYFRAINFSSMSRAFETANGLMERMHSSMAYGTLMTDNARREDLINSLRVGTSKFLVLQIRRDNVLLDAFNQLWRREERELSRPLKVKLGEDNGEEGSDSGGVQQEFFRLAIAEALSPNYGTFTIDERTRMTWFQPGSPEPLWKFEFIGLIMSLAVYNGLTLPITFPKTLYRKILGAPVSELHHIEDGWPDLASGLTTLLDWDEKDGLVSDVFSRTYEFSVELFGQQISRDMTAERNKLWPQFGDRPVANPTHAPLVDSSNRNEYVSDYIQWLIDISVRPQFEAFERGFLTCLSRRSLSLFTPELLQSVVEGVQDIDISELRHYTRYVGWDASHPRIKDFWSIVKKFDSEEKKKLLEFVTASDRVPVGGMRNLQFVVQRNGVGDVDGHLPTSYTCYGTLLLPEYSSKDVLKQKLGMALENAKGFGFA